MQVKTSQIIVEDMIPRGDLMLDPTLGPWGATAPSTVLLMTVLNPQTIPWMAEVLCIVLRTLCRVQEAGLPGRLLRPLKMVPLKQTVILLSQMWSVMLILIHLGTFIGTLKLGFIKTDLVVIALMTRDQLATVTAGRQQPQIVVRRTLALVSLQLEGMMMKWPYLMPVAFQMLLVLLLLQTVRLMYLSLLLMMLDRLLISDLLLTLLPPGLSGKMCMPQEPLWDVLWMPRILLRHCLHRLRLHTHLWMISKVARLNKRLCFRLTSLDYLAKLLVLKGSMYPPLILVLSIMIVKRKNSTRTKAEVLAMREPAITLLVLPAMYLPDLRSPIHRDHLLSLEVHIDRSSSAPRL